MEDRHLRSQESPAVEHCAAHPYILSKKEQEVLNKAMLKSVKIISPAWIDISNRIGGHNGEYDHKCSVCGYVTWFARYTDPNKEQIRCPACLIIMEGKRK